LAGGGAGPDQGGPVTSADVPPGPLSTESILRLGLVVLLSVGAVSLFAVLLGGSFRRA
jgi:hypothetical protein